MDDIQRGQIETTMGVCVFGEVGWGGGGNGGLLEDSGVEGWGWTVNRTKKRNINGHRKGRDKDKYNT